MADKAPGSCRPAQKSDGPGWLSWRRAQVTGQIQLVQMCARVDTEGQRKL